MTAAGEAAWARFLALGRDQRADGHPPGAIRPLFATGGRFRRFSWRGGDLLLDLSKTALTEAVLNAALDLACAVDLAGQRDAMARGERVNTTERRAALHLALRAPPEVAMRAGDEDATAAVQDSLARMRAFCDAVHAGTAAAEDGGRFTDVLNIGIGGSDLGPAMAARALWTPAAPLRPHYLANVDGHAWEEIRARLDPARTLVLIASKTFTTQETMENAGLARAWLAAAVGEAGVGAHLAALSTNLPATASFGIAPERVFGFRDWIGGRFSLWSAIGLSVALALGWDAFARLLAGARIMDEHFLAAPLDANLPVLLAIAEIWHVNALGYPTRAVLPYDERLARLPAHLQQVEMESLGKRVTRDGAPVTRATGPVVFGEPGTNAQHSFMQLIHHSPTPVPCDVILVANPDHPHADSHAKLLANGLAQTEALLEGRSLDSVTAQMRAAGADAAEIARLAPHRVFPGDRPSATILLPRLDPFTLGQLVALYEHKVAALGALWGINPFDQFGVELGKEVCAAILPELEHGPAPDAHDSSTRGLIREIRRAQGAA